jgi:hypothetical protein
LNTVCYVNTAAAAYSATYHAATALLLLLHAVDSMQLQASIEPCTAAGCSCIFLLKVTALVTAKWCGMAKGMATAIAAAGSMSGHLVLLLQLADWPCVHQLIGSVCPQPYMSRHLNISSIKGAETLHRGSIQVVTFDSSKDSSHRKRIIYVAISTLNPAQTIQLFAKPMRWRRCATGCPCCAEIKEVLEQSDCYACSDKRCRIIPVGVLVAELWVRTRM